MNKQRFINFNLFTIQYPLTAVVSILHRISGVFVFLFIPVLLWLLDVSLSSASEFEHIRSVLMNPIIKILLWLILVALWYHLMAGLRHLLMDIGIGEDLQGGRFSAKIIIVIIIALAVLIRVWLW
jgi:succinate dehydrogenase / fumarate reductase cytochrome b subunit